MGGESRPPRLSSFKAAGLGGLRGRVEHIMKIDFEAWALEKINLGFYIEDPDGTWDVEVPS